MRVGKSKMTKEQAWRKIIMSLQSSESLTNKQMTMLDDVDKIEIVTEGDEFKHISLTLSKTARNTAKKAVQKYLTQLSDLKIEIS